MYKRQVGDGDKFLSLCSSLFVNLLLNTIVKQTESGFRLKMVWSEMIFAVWGNRDFCFVFLAEAVSVLQCWSAVQL